jgi:hypothetical protein
MTNPPGEYRSMSVADILDSLALQIYEPPLSKLREDLRSIREVLRISILIIDFDTEVHINGILGFLENSTGLYLTDTIEALETIAAHDTAKTLRAIHRIMSEHGVTVERLRSDFANAQEFQITSFNELHGEELSRMADLIVRESRELYVYDRTTEQVFDLLLAYLERRRDEFVALLEACSASG